MREKCGKIVRVQWVKENKCNQTIFDVFSVLSFGFLPVASVVDPALGTNLRCEKCLPREADFIIASVYIDEETIKEYVADITHYDGLNEEHIISFQLNCERYCASSGDNFNVHSVDNVPRNFKSFLQKFPRNVDASESALERDILQIQYGENAMHIPAPTTFQITVRHSLNPIVVFGYFAAIIWYIEYYYWYATLVVVLDIATIILMVEATKFNLRRLQELAGVVGTVQVMDPLGLSPPFTVPDGYLVVGDQFLLSEGDTLPCDAVLLSGRVVVDESMLTGESVPVSKQPIDVAAIGASPDDNTTLLTGRKPFGKASAIITEYVTDPTSTSAVLIALDANSANTTKSVPPSPVQDLSEAFPGSVLYGGTRVKHCVSGESVAVVYRTGFRSAKGQLVSSLIEPKEGFLHFFDDMVAVIVLIFLIATVLYVYQAYYLRSIGESWSEIVILYFNAITVAIPIALAVCLIAATGLAIYRLNQKEIYISDSSRINYAGIVDCVCFDKTGSRLFFRFLVDARPAVSWVRSIDPLLFMYFYSHVACALYHSLSLSSLILKS
jgi:magnesium-transporting ATPase (P-type)